MEFRPLLEHRCSAESPVWDDRRQCVFFVDFTQPAVRCANLDGSGHRHWPMPELASSIGLGESGRLIVAQPRSLLILDPDSGQTQLLARIVGEPADNRLNDGKVGPDGAFWVGSMDMRPARERLGSLYRVSGKGEVTLVLRQETEISNGLAWSDDGRVMYFSDSRGPWVDRFDFDPATGTMRNRVRFAELSETLGRPDGAACDVRGRYWSAGVSAGRLNVFGTDGAIEAVIPTPVAAPSMPAFCGPDLDRMVVTSLMPANPGVLDGALLIADAPVRGARVHRWRDR
ncbi:SMP-30/gluconolactonase/LRE family protein [Devosia sp. SL43]|uniref:SMP-30/gluconolactonase/LRE family protein n=1 Tax=Devosia sp. SL43 TaxID=2806348 RepID=UPI001F398AFE|nr:SMP-30/gluconolactonase/LRE family protein [Devosia sp. SL43]UJW87414.1 SMP-30/gluconolactonase/LRE family protein [Devosia sp. SL43]